MLILMNVFAILKFKLIKMIALSSKLIFNG